MSASTRRRLDDSESGSACSPHNFASCLQSTPCICPLLWTQVAHNPEFVAEFLVADKSTPSRPLTPQSQACSVEHLRIHVF